MTWIKIYGLCLVSVSSSWLVASSLVLKVTLLQEEWQSLFWQVFLVSLRFSFHLQAELVKMMRTISIVGQRTQFSPCSDSHFLYSYYLCFVSSRKYSINHIWLFLYSSCFIRIFPIHRTPPVTGWAFWIRRFHFLSIISLLRDNLLWHENHINIS